MLAEDFYCYQFQLEPLNSWQEILLAHLSNLPFDSFQETDSGVDAFVKISEDCEKEVKEILEDFTEVSISYQKKKIEKVNWNEEWEKNFQPILIGNKCYVRAEFHEPKPEIDYEIVIQPKMSFGTGHHETTHLILEYLLKTNVNGLDVLDMGCGTGVLGILGKMKGAKSVKGIDIDEWSIENSVENAERNQVDVSFELGGAEKLGKQSYNMILANINKNILLQDLSTYESVLKKGGTLILSGILHSDFDDMKLACEALNLNFKNKTQRNEWISIELVK